jgi:hypothetical protein
MVVPRKHVLREIHSSSTVVLAINILIHLEAVVKDYFPCPISRQFQCKSFLCKHELQRKNEGDIKTVRVENHQLKARKLKEEVIVTGGGKNAAD